MIITDIQKRRKMLNAIYIDGEFAVDIDREILLISGYKVGSNIDNDALYNLIKDSDFKRARERALYLLEHRDYSKSELVKKIFSVIKNEEAAHAAADRMEELDLINDINFAKKYANDLINIKKFSLKRVEYELIKKGIKKEDARNIIEALDIDPINQIISVINKKYIRSINDQKGRQKTILALQRLGYKWDDIKSALFRFPGINSEDEY